MGEFSGREFGLIIAYILPGMALILGLSPLSPTITGWLAAHDGSGPTLAGFLYFVVASLGAGLVASVIRWGVIDQLHHYTGLNRPQWDDRKLADSLEAFNYLVENHYRYYQFYANTLVALPCAYLVQRISSPNAAMSVWTDFLLLATCCFLFAGSRNALQLYYRRAVTLLGTVRERKPVMTNGNHAAEQSGLKPATGAKLDSADKSPAPPQEAPKIAPKPTAK